MKRKATSILLLGTLLALMQGCSDSGTQVDSRYHRITAAPNDDCRIDVKAQELAGEQVLVAVTLLNETVEIASVTYNGQPCQDRTEGGGPFSSTDSRCRMRT